MPKSEELLVQSLVKLFAELRKAQGLTFDALAELADVHRTTIGLFERGERTPTVQVAAQIAQALGLPLSSAVRQAEEQFAKVENTSVAERERVAKDIHFLHDEQLFALIGLRNVALQKAINNCYRTLDGIDTQLISQRVRPIAQLVELANLSSMIGNLVGSGLAEASDGLYQRNRLHHYPDLVPQQASAVALEIKVALETNSPKGHLVKPGFYLTFRYVLGNRQGGYERGKQARGDTVWIWEVKVGELSTNDFSVSNTAGDSGKTAVIKLSALQNMTTVYYVPHLLPYAKARS